MQVRMVKAIQILDKDLGYRNSVHYFSVHDIFHITLAMRMLLRETDYPDSLF